MIRRLISMKTRRYDETAAMKNPHGVDARALYDAPEATINIIALQPGQALKKHVTPVDVVFYVLEGRGTVEIGEEKQEVGRDTLVESPKMIPHCWYNTGDALLRVMVIKTPRQAEKTVLTGK